MKYRSRTDIIAHMLEAACTGGITKTKIMYTAFVPHEQMGELIHMLTDNSLMHFEPSTHRYETTTKGIQFLTSYNNMHDCLEV